MMDTAPLRITVANVSVSLGGRPALRDVSWRLHGAGNAPEHWAVLGDNGAGKSTFLRLLRGDLRPDQDDDGNFIGRCLWNVEGEDDPSPLVIKPVSRLISAEQHRLYVRRGWNISGRDLVLSGFQDSLLPSPSSGKQDAVAEKLAGRLGITYLLDRPVTALSQGQLRLALLAKAMVGSPRLLLLDEPFDGLDHTARGVLHGAINAASKQAVIVCTAHRESDLPSCITHILRLSRGKVVFSGPAAVSATARDEAVIPAPVTAALKHGRGDAHPNASPAPAPRRAKRRGPRYALELYDADVYVDRVKVLHALTWKLPVGENWRIAGPNGSGKSTLLRLVAGFEHVALGGRLLWFGREYPPLALRLKETGFLSDLLHATYTYDLTGLDLVATGFDGTVGVWRKNTKKEREEAMRWIDFLGLADMAKSPVSRLSSGTARRFFLARALVGSPKILLLDEPCSGLDVQARAQFIASLEAVLAKGVQCLYVSHHDADVPPSVNHTLFLEEGRIVGTS